MRLSETQTAGNWRPNSWGKRWVYTVQIKTNMNMINLFLKLLQHTRNNSVNAKFINIRHCINRKIHLFNVLLFKFINASYTNKRGVFRFKLWRKSIKLYKLFIS